MFSTVLVCISLVALSTAFIATKMEESAKSMENLIVSGEETEPGSCDRRPENGVSDQVDRLCHGLSRNLNCLLDDNRNTRKRALESIRKEALAMRDRQDLKACI